MTQYCDERLHTPVSKPLNEDKSHDTLDQRRALWLYNRQTMDTHFVWTPRLVTYVKNTKISKHSVSVHCSIYVFEVKKHFTYLEVQYK